MLYNYQLFGLPVLCWAFIILAIAIIMFMPSGKRKESAKEILLKKFADGTLSQEQYEERKSVLAKDSTTRKSSNWF